MPLFYLHVCNGSGFTRDDQGQDFADVDAARAAAVQGLRDMMAEEIRGGQIFLATFIEIEDGDRRLVSTVPFTEAVELVSDPCGRPAA